MHLATSYSNKVLTGWSSDAKVTNFRNSSHPEETEVTDASMAVNCEITSLRLSSNPDNVSAMIKWCCTSFFRKQFNRFYQIKRIDCPQNFEIKTHSYTWLQIISVLYDLLDFVAHIT